ncbi:MAG: hypothetical protein LLG20_04150 [Acidobacteriales bacterium]|nr:hypothetical protein [Terriglobales bacterium]
MNYWLTTHWPPQEDNPSDVAGGVWVPDGREAAGRELRAGDLVLIYQSRSGRTEVRRSPDGTKTILHSIKGAEGIIAIARAEDGLTEDADSHPTTYLDGTEIWWRWFAPVEVLSRTGFVPRVALNNVLGYAPGYNLRGFGDYHSGLKRLSEQQYNALAEIFRNHNPNVLPPAQPFANNTQGHRYGSGLESDEHRLLKEYVASDPSRVLGEGGLKSLAVEYDFPTGDRADCVFEDAVGRIIGVEIEVAVGDAQLEGALQAIKYRYMLEPLTKRALGDSRAFLVAYAISPGMLRLCNGYVVECFVVNKQEVDTWAADKQAVRQPERTEAANA